MKRYRPSPWLLLPAVAAAVWLLFQPFRLWIIACSLLTFIVFAYDKWSAERGGGRISERTLHLLSLIGGWPGGIAAQLAFRHKTAKPAFQRTLRLVVVTQVSVSAILTYLFFRSAP